ncbi:MAG: hypothetical protein IJ597_04840, partial [Synergistaceae bacterium]|nr:hypothetical protein [Synergistaceae bacterium]
MKKFFFAITLVFLIPSVLFAASDDVYLRKDVFDAKMEVLFERIDKLDAKIESLNEKVEKNFVVLNDKIDRNFAVLDDKISVANKNADSRISDLRNGFYLVITFFAFVVGLPLYHRWKDERKSKSPFLTREDVVKIFEQLIDAKLQNFTQAHVAEASTE